MDSSCLELDPGDIQKSNELIGEGTYGKAFEADYFGAVCVAKELRGALETDSLKAGVAQNDRELKDHFLNKYQSMARLRHPNVVQFLGIYFKLDPSKPVPVLVMEKMESSLSALLESHPNIPNAVKMSILLDVSLGLRYLHGQKPAVVHSNLTSNNVLLTSQLQAKISDVGVIQLMDGEKKPSKKNARCAPFMAPEMWTEIFSQSACSPSVDIFSYGTVILYTVTQQWPDPLVDTLEQNVSTQTEVERRQSQINQIPASYNKLLKSLVVSCLDGNPSRRPTIIQVSNIVKNISEKLLVTKKSPIAWQAEVEQTIKQVITL